MKKATNILDYFKEQVAKTPAAPAVRFQNRVLTYKDLDKSSDNLAFLIKNRLSGQHTLYAYVYMERSCDVVTAMLAVFKAGMIYVPLDADWPLERVSHIIKEGHDACVITNYDLPEHIFDVTTAIIKITNCESHRTISADSNPIAYVIYTSGSTGHPKGVVISHQALLASSLARANYYGPVENIVLIPSFGFDASLAVIWWAFLSGGCLHIVSGQTLKSATGIRQVFQRNKIDAVVCVPSYYRFLLDEDVFNIFKPAIVILGGESWGDNLVDEHYSYSPQSILYNEYGPTECTIWATVSKIHPGSGVNLGHPVPGVELVLLDHDQQPVCKEDSGEIYLSGQQLSTGYLNMEAETKEAFISLAGTLFYKTGDIAKYDSEGSLIYLGRKDNQIKIDGHRIELGEIEQTILSHPEIKQAQVLHVSDTNNYLVGFYITSDYGNPVKEQLHSFLEKRLPSFMIPSELVAMPDFPLTFNGKVDSQQLLQRLQKINSQRLLVYPQTDVESNMLTCWQQLFGEDTISTTDDFTGLGGTSLLAMRMVSYLDKKFHYQVAIEEIFRYGTIKALASLHEMRHGKQRELIMAHRPYPHFSPISYQQRQMWVIDQLEGSRHYHIEINYQLEGRIDILALKKSLNILLSRHKILQAILYKQGEEIVQAYSHDSFLLEEISDPEHFSTFLERPFDLFAGPMFRAAIFSRTGHADQLYFVFHHIISDGWSLSILLAELAIIYQANIEHKVSELPALEINYLDYVFWQQKALNSPKVSASLVYWKEKLADLSPSSFPPDRRYPALPSRKGSSISLLIPKAVKDQILTLCREEKVTLYVFLLTILKILISKYNNGLEDVCVGSVLANRTDPRAIHLVGYMANTVALRSVIGQKMTVSEILQVVRATVLEAHAHGEVAFESVVDTLNIPRSPVLNPLFGTMLVFQDSVIPAELSFDSVSWHLQHHISKTSKFDLLLDIKESDGGLQVLFEYNTDIYEHKSINDICCQFQHLIHAVLASNTSMEVSALDWVIDNPVPLTDAASVSFPDQLTINDVFKVISDKFPHHTAVVYQGNSLSYAELNALSNRLGNYLRDRGVSTDVLVPICADRSLEMVIGILGILKAGGAYVPIDPLYPQDRIRFMLEDTGSEFVLLTKLVKLDSPLQQIILDGEEWRLYPDTEVLSRSGPEDLAYVIYTSGSTGRPKGVMIEHHNVIRLFFNDTPLFDFGANDIWCLFHSFCFDFSVWEMYGALLFGGKLVIVPKDSLNPFDFEQLLQEEKVTVLNQTPTAFYALQEYVLQRHSLLKIRYVIFGGEALSPYKVAPWRSLYPQCKLINMYGITETTVHVTYKEITNKEIIAGVSNIGIPIPTLGCLVLDQQQRYIPQGMAGELYVSGHGLARGYLHNEQLTGERFVVSPFNAGERLYRTGDLVRWHSDGALEYLGRIDDQVKIRGYRIELGEIETVLQRSGQVSQNVVIAREGKLIAYVVSATFNKSGLLAYLHTQLPDYMVPSMLVSLDHIPMTANGKVNRKALPEPESLLETGYEQPRTKTEELLCGIWQELLGLGKIGINDNFFEIGGDSIVSIQVVSRARKQGLHLQPRDIFRYQTIRSLSGLLSSVVEIQAEQGELTGPADLLPIQHWFFSQGHQSIFHYNQSLLLGVSKSIERNQLQDIVNVLLGHHDALRFRYQFAEGVWEQRYGQGTIELEEADLSGEDLPSVCSKYQKGLDITHGPLFRAVLLRTPEASSEHLLLMVAHHLCVDGVSWRIIAADLHHCLENLSQKKPVTLGTKGSSYRQWRERLQRYAESSLLDKQYPYWTSILAGYAPLPVDYELKGPRLISGMKRESTVLSISSTHLLLHEIHATYHTEVKDILLTALALSLKDWTGAVHHLIGLEGHGREDLGSDIDLSHTAGWFTTLYPFLLEMEIASETDYGKLICGIKERLREIPDEGLGYGVSRYLHPKGTVREQMAVVSQFDLVFNYLGQLGNLVNNSPWLSQPADMILSAGDLSGDDNSYSFRLGIDSYIYQDQFRLVLSYSTAEYATDTIRWLSSKYIHHLESLIAHCIAHQTKGRYTPSDYGLTGKITLKALEVYKATSGAADRHDLYGMSSLQEGMLFHGLYDNSSGTYIEQFSCELKDVDPQILKSSWEQVIAGYSILRSSFCDQGFNALIQRVHHNPALPFGQLDLSELNEAEQKTAIEAFLIEDRLQGFDFHSPPLMRVKLLHLNEHRSRMVWTFHHILLDGWSVPLVISDLQSAYGRLITGKKLSLMPVDNYGDFIQYLQLRNKFAEQEYWKSYLAGFDTPTLLPFTEHVSRRNQGTGDIGTEVILMDAAFSGQIQLYGQQQHLTVSTMMQGVWSYLLSRYTGQDDVLFGVTVSGRPTDLENADRRVGLYIHTIPQRSVMAKEGTFRDWLLTLQQGHTLSREYPYIPLTAIQDLLGIKGDLFDSLLVFENYPVYATEGAESGLSLSGIQLAEHTNYMLTIIVEPGANLRLSFSYNKELLSPGKVAMIAAHFKYVLEQAVSNPDLLLHEIELADTAERKRLQDFQGKQASFPQETLTSLFSASALLHGHHTAIVYGDMSLTYAELDKLSNSMGHYLQAQGVSAGMLVPICTDRCFEMIIGILGILKAGGAYVPIDPLYPQDRIHFMLEDTGATFVLTGTALGADCPLQQLMLENGEWREYQDTQVSCVSTVEDLAYVIYTSGSTGRPKGVMNAHLGVVNRLIWAGQYYNLGINDVILQKTTFCFDVSVWELLLPLLYGSQLVLARPGGQRDNDYLKALIDKKGITMLHFVPGMLEVFLPDLQPGDCSSLRQVICSGEALKPEQVALFSKKLSHAKLYNLYGPTEAAIDVTCWPVPLSPLPERVLIGTAVSNVALYVLDKNQRLQPVGVSGELYIGGVQVARGYLHNEQLTGERFVVSPFNAGERLYRTGDLVRWHSDGALEYLGRIDDQVKIRGYRIELGEIETVLQRSGQVSQNVVIAREGKLIAYVVSATFNKSGLLAYLHTQLPDYMVPSMLVSLDHIPMTANGKVNRKALPEPESLLETGYEQPRTKTEELLCGIWQELLGLGKIGINDNFFEIGGDSILLIRLFQALNSHFKKAVNVSDLFKYNSIKLQAKLMQGKSTAATHQIEV